MIFIKAFILIFFWSPYIVLQQQYLCQDLLQLGCWKCIVFAIYACAFAMGSWHLELDVCIVILVRWVFWIFCYCCFCPFWILAKCGGCWRYLCFCGLVNVTKKCRWSESQQPSMATEGTSYKVLLQVRKCYKGMGMGWKEWLKGTVPKN